MDMDILDMLLKLFTPVIVIITAIWHFATRNARDTNTAKAQEVLSDLIKENHSQISDKIEMVKVEQSRLNTEVELTKLRVQIIESHR